MKELESLNLELKKTGSPIINYFKEGLSENETNRFFKENSLVPTLELIELYKWHNGLIYEGIPSGKLSFGIGGVFLPLHDSIDNYQNFFREKFPFYFPIFWDDSFLINLDQNSNKFGKIFIYSPSLLIIEPLSCYDNLITMFETIVFCFRNKIFSYSNDGFFEEEIELSSEISKKLNPHSQYWK